MLAIFSYIEAVAKSPQPLLITGESGVGKELIARAAHTPERLPGPLVAVNVAGLDDAVFADTLFGHVRGAFTGADQPRRGMIEEAADGTLFLDEIGDLSIASQVKLLRLLQEGEYFPLGSDRPKRLRARVIVATHQRPGGQAGRRARSGATSTSGSAPTMSISRRCGSGRGTCRSSWTISWTRRPGRSARRNRLRPGNWRNSSPPTTSPAMSAN